jgi:sugar-specific transcriptional regulator TrmB
MSLLTGDEPMTAAQLVAATGMSRGVVYQTLRGLVASGDVEKRDGDGRSAFIASTGSVAPRE